MPAFEPRFPTNLSLGAEGGCGWKTGIVIAGDGYEYRTGGWGRSMGRWSVGHNLRTAQERDQLIAFHRAMRGTAQCFRFRDWADYTAGPGEGHVMPYPAAPEGTTILAKLYTVTNVFGAPHGILRAIHKPRSDIVFSPPGPVYDYTTGIVIGGTPGGATMWTGEFDVWAHFDEDIAAFSVDTPTGTGWRGIGIVEGRLNPGDPA